MEISMRGNGRIGHIMVTVNILGLKGIGMKEDGKMGSFTVMGH